MSVLVVSGERVFPIGVPADRELVVGRGAQAEVRLDDPKLAPRHLSLRLEVGGRVEVRDLMAGGTRLNDVQLSGASSARPGDQISLGDSLLLVQAASPPAARALAPVSHAELEERLCAELSRSRVNRRPVALLLIHLPGAARGDRRALLPLLAAEASAVAPGASFGEYGGEVLELLCPESPATALEVLKDRVTAALGSRGLRFKLGQALAPEDGADADALQERALSRLLGPMGAAVDELVLLDPVMVRLLAILDRFAQSEAPLLLEGAPGVGKQALARALHQRGRRPGSKFRSVRCGGLSEGELDGALKDAAEDDEPGNPNSGERKKGGTLYLKAVGALPHALQSKLARILAEGPGPARLVCAAGGAAELRPELAERLSSMRLSLPLLADRRADVLPLAEHFLSRARRALGRPGLSLSAEARKALVAYGWPGNVRELKNAIERGALVAGGDELGLDELPRTVVSAASSDLDVSGGLRASMRAAEREVLLRALEATQWNVTAAAKNLGLPRRTVVYRMSRLSLRRPA